MPIPRSLILYLSFHRRMVIGILLLIAVALFLAFGLPYMPRLAGSRNPIQRETSEHNEAGATRLDDRQNSDEKFNDASPDILASNDIDLLFQDLNRLQANLIRNSTHSVKLLTSVQTGKVARRLLELDLDQEQRRYVMNALADSLLISGMTSLEAGYPIEHLEGEILRTAEKMKADDDSAIQLKGAWLIVAYWMTSFHLTSSNEHFELASQAIENEFADVELAPRIVENFCQLLIAIRSPQKVLPQNEELLERFMRRLINDPSPEIREIGERFAAVIHFKLPSLHKLRSVLADGGTASEQQVEELFAGLATHPTAPVLVYQLALDCIRAELLAGNNVRAVEMIQQLRDQAISQIPDQETKQAIDTALGELKELSND